MVCEMESFLSQVPAEFSDPEQLALEATVLNHEQSFFESRRVTPSYALFP
jgi:hypothetical protein